LAALQRPADSRRDRIVQQPDDHDQDYQQDHERRVYSVILSFIQRRGRSAAGYGEE
jgi:hypothetical protein